ncbi:hypothetical protein RhiirA5_408957 [Rhizophagus irregularis]|uniref:Uncharacterized protein n=1 Tax=Rhizophagus irregularis TaxID=588596 RepID=A0A2N0Q714_9GLOM|nr:hypothetical protein RhiirA5_408957 [Rhizophagus irregularis]
MNLHAATSLAEDLGLDLVDIYRIYKWIQMQASPLNDPDIVAEMPSCGSGMRKLRRHNDRAVEKKEKAGDALGRSFEGEGIGNREL